MDSLSLFPSFSLPVFARFLFVLRAGKMQDSETGKASRERVLGEQAIFVGKGDEDARRDVHEDGEARRTFNFQPPRHEEGGQRWKQGED